MKILNGKRVFTLELSDEQLQVVSDGLNLVAFGRAAPVVVEINRQLKLETGPQPVPAEAPAEMPGQEKLQSPLAVS